MLLKDITEQETTEIDSFMDKALVVSENGERFHILESKKAEREGDDDIIFDRANFEFKKDALALWKKIIQDVQKKTLKERIDTLDETADEVVNDIKQLKFKLNE